MTASSLAPPPVFALPFGTVRGGVVYLTPGAIQFLTQMFAAAQGVSASIPDSFLFAPPLQAGGLGL